MNNRNQGDVVKVSPEKSILLFNALDKDMNGLISIEDLTTRLATLLNLVPDGYKKMHLKKDTEFDKNGDNQFDSEEFQNLLEYHGGYLEKDGPHIMDMLNIFDTDNNCLITKEEFQDEMNNVGDALEVDFSQDDINILFNPSVNEDEQIGYDELAKAANCFGLCIGGNMVTLAVLLL